MNNAEYWRERFKELEESGHRKDTNFAKKLIEIFQEAARNLDYALFKFFKRFADIEHISLQEANRLLNSEELKAFKMTVEEYVKLGESQNVHYNKDIEKTLEEASLKVRVTRLEALSYEMSAIIGKATGSENALLYEYLARAYEDRYYRTAFTIFKNYGVGVSFSKINTKTLDNLLKTPWAADGINFSDRIWNNQTKLINTLRNIMADSCIRGSGYSETSEKLAKQMKTTLTNATRLVATESAFFSSEAQKDCFNELGAEKYEIIATLDEVTDDECQQLDGKVFDMKDFKSGQTAPPFHVNCRCVTAPYFDDSDVPGYVEGTRTARNAGGKTYRVPRSMKYPEWKKKYVDNNKSNSKSTNLLEVSQAESNIAKDNKQSKIKGNNSTKKSNNISNGSTYNRYNLVNKLNIIDLNNKDDIKKIPKLKNYDITNTKANKLNISDHASNPLESEPNDIMDRFRDLKVIQRSYFNQNSKRDHDYDLTNHSNSKRHPNVPHKHIYKYNKNGEMIKKIEMPLTKDDWKEIEDIYEPNDT